MRVPAGDVTAAAMPKVGRDHPSPALRSRCRLFRSTNGASIWTTPPIPRLYRRLYSTLPGRLPEKWRRLNSPTACGPANLET